MTRVSMLVVIQVLLSCAADVVAQQAEPSWFPYIKATFQGTNLQRCGHRSTAPSNGAKCGRLPKTCFFGNQPCPDISTIGTYPLTRCDCDCSTGAWNCKALLCPAATTTAPTNPEQQMGSDADDVPSSTPSVMPTNLPQPPPSPPPTPRPTDLPTPRPTPRPVGMDPTRKPTPRPSRPPTML